MKLFTKVFGRMRRTSGKKLVMTAALFGAMTVAGFAGVSSYTNSKAAAGDCSGNSIVPCGEPGSGQTGRQELVNAIKASPELQKIYARFGLTQADYSRFITSARPGVAYRSNNTIVVDGRVVETNASSIGRYKSFQGSNPQTFSIAGAGTYYGNLNSKAFAANTSAIPVDVLFDSTGKMQFAVMTSVCGNPAYGSPVQPTYACHNIIPTRIGNADANTWHFKTNADAANGAKITKLVYNFGDGTPTATAYTPDAPVAHIFTKSSKVTVSVYVSVPGGGTVVLSNCVFQVPFTPPPAVFACTLLTLTPATIDTKGNQVYTLTGQATAQNATIKSYNFTFGDSSTAVVKTAATKANTVHVYAPGNYTASVSVTVLTNTGLTKTVTAPTCAKPVSVKPLPSTLACVNLTTTAGAVDSTTGATAYTLAAQASASNATITSYVFSFGDNTPNVTVTSASTASSTTHVYQPGTWNAMVTVNGKDAKGNPITAPAVPACAKSVTVKTPECKPGVPVGSPQCQPSSLVCENLSLVPGTVDSTTGNQTFTLNATASANNATITSYVFTFGDSAQPLSVPTTANTASTTHTYAPGTYTASVVVNGKDAANNPIQATAASCAKPITVTPPVCKPGVPVGNSQCFTYTCDLLSVTKGDNRTVTVSAFKASSTNPNATLTNVTLDWGDGNTVPPMADIVGQTHQYGADNTYNITATAHFTVPDQTDTITASGPNCVQTVSYTTPTPPVTPPTTLVNTGAGSVFGIFAAVAVVGTLAHRLFLGRRLAR